MNIERQMAYLAQLRARPAHELVSVPAATLADLVELAISHQQMVAKVQALEQYVLRLEHSADSQPPGQCLHS